ncbi:MAG: nucleotidyltransferase family protein [Pseudomonadales bacterium]|nr:nucleotidyltransferase family protein [Pseudomonadales bacterium]
MNRIQITDTTILVMAAGSSSRFGSDKRQAILNNKSILETTLEKATPWKHLIRVILAAGDEPLQKSLSDRGVTAHIAKNAHLGMGHSLADGIQLLEQHDPESNRCLVMLADMPYVQTSTLQVLLSALQRHNLVVPRFQGKTGNPVGFGRCYFSELKKLTGDRGGKRIVQENLHLAHKIDTGDIGILKDIDRPEQIH